MSKIYLVFVGEYSERKCVIATTNKAKAEEFVEVHNRDCDYYEAEIVEYEDGERYDYTKPLFTVHFKDCKYDSCDLTSIETRCNAISCGEINKVISYSHLMQHINVFAEDEEHAKKIACDIMAEYLAEKNGVI